VLHDVDAEGDGSLRGAGGGVGEAGERGGCRGLEWLRLVFGGGGGGVFGGEVIADDARDVAGDAACTGGG
jgi:hypothetical protein